MDPDDKKLDDVRCWELVTSLVHPISPKNCKVPVEKGTAVTTTLIPAKRDQQRGKIDVDSIMLEEKEKKMQLPLDKKIIKQQKSNLYLNTDACTEKYGLLTSIDKKTKAKVDKGKYPIERTIDLHNCTMDLAYKRLIDFITTGFESGCKCLLVITGWGSTNFGRSSIRSNLYKWLQCDSVVRMVLYYREALPVHGGKGAFYVLLRSHRKVLKT